MLPLHCDGYGHMNVRNYAGFFDDAGWHILRWRGSRSARCAAGLGTVVVTLTIDFTTRSSPAARPRTGVINGRHQELMS